MIKHLNINSGYTPTGKLSWATKLASEFLGTIFLTWMIGILGVSFNGLKFEVILSGKLGFASHLVIGFWVAMDILICLAIFSRWSCDLNPAVTTYRMIDKQNSVKFGMIKIFVQLLGGLVAGLAIWSTQEIAHHVSQSSSDLVTSPHFEGNFASFGTSHFSEVVVDTSLAWKPSLTWEHIAALGGEFIGVFILLWPIMTKSIKSPIVRDMVLILIIGFGVAALLELGTVGWNPARTLGTNYIMQILNPAKTQDPMTIYWAYAIGPILAAFALYYGQKATHKIEKIWEKWLSIGKVHDVDKHADKTGVDKIKAKKKTNK